VGEFKEAADSWNQLYSNHTPLAVVYPRTLEAVAGSVECALKAGVRTVPRRVGRRPVGWVVDDWWLGPGGWRRHDSAI